MSKLLDRILGESNMIIALHQVKLKKGSGGVDGIEIEDIEEYIQNNWKRIKSQIKERKYKPQPVLRVEIPKSNGGVNVNIKMYKSDKIKMYNYSKLT